MGLFAFLFGCGDDDEEAPASVQDAVNLQMQPLWTAVHGTAFDFDDDLAHKQKRIDVLSAWAGKTEDRATRKAQRYWISVAQYTINRERQERSKKRSAEKLLPSLPPLPSIIKRQFPY